jgi:hypothetical protein
VNRDALLAWLDAKAVGRDPIITATYQGLAARIRRGDFDDDREEVT